MAVAALEEISWRGFVYSLLEERLGTRRAWPATAVLYALAHLPTVFLLRDPFAGPNPLVVLAALGCGLVWGLIVARTGACRRRSFRTRSSRGASRSNSRSGASAERPSRAAMSSASSLAGDYSACISSSEMSKSA